jgi:tetratricopeptide (TPR) repeat protein
MHNLKEVMVMKWIKKLLGFKDKTTQATGGGCKYCGESRMSLSEDGLCKTCSELAICIDGRSTIMAHLSLLEPEIKSIPPLFQQNLNELDSLVIKFYHDYQKLEKSGNQNEIDNLIINFIQDYKELERSGNHAGWINGKYYTEYAELVEQLKREKKHEEAIELLLKLIDAVEREAQIYRAYNWNHFAAPWYYEQLAIIYRKEKRYSDEVAILERHQKINRGAGSTKLALRLDGARIRAMGLLDKEKKA